MFIAQLKQQIGIQAMLKGINDAFFVATFIAAVAFILAFFIKRPGKAEDPKDDESVDKKVPIKLVLKN